MKFSLIFNNRRKIMIYKDWLKEWLRLYVKPYVKERTYNKYVKQVDLHIIPLLGDYDMEDLTAAVLQDWSVKLQDSGFSPNTVNSIISRLKDSLKKAVISGVITKEFSGNIIRPKSREKQVDCFNKAEQKKIEQYILAKQKPKLYGFLVCLYTGLRIGELLALTWKDVDLNNGRIIINKSCHDSWINGKYVKIIDTTKTESSERIIPLPKQLLPILKDLKKKSNRDYIIDGKSEYGAQVRSYQKTFERLLNKLNIPHKGFHSLRHTFATRALECGMDIKTLSEILGHKNANITLKRYAHSLYEHKAEMMNKIGRILQEI